VLGGERADFTENGGSDRYFETKHQEQDRYEQNR